jgi:hypothetical protein
MTAVLSECNLGLLWFSVFLNGEILVGYGVWELINKTAHLALKAVDLQRTHLLAKAGRSPTPVPNRTPLC